MKVKAITVGKAVLVNIQNYENVRIEKKVEIEIEEGDDVKKIQADAMEEINNYLSAEVDDIEIKQRKSLSKARRFGI